MNRNSLAAPTLWILIVAFALAGPVLAMVPLGMAPLLIATATLAYTSERIAAGIWTAPPKIVSALLLALLSWCALSLIWTLNPTDGFRKLLDLVMILLAFAALLALAKRIDWAQRRTLAAALIAGVVIGLFLLGIETIFDFPLYRLVKGASDPKLADLVESKRSVDALPLLVWPACVGFATLGSAWAGAILAVVFFFSCIKLTASSATLGMLLSLLVFAAGFVSVKWVRRALGALTLAAFVLVIPVAFLAYSRGMTHAHWLKRSAQHRVEIWHFAGGRALERPALGWGFNSSRFIPNGNAVSEFLAPGKPLIPLHPHDGFLQILLELGVIGGVIVSAMLLISLGSLARWPDSRARFVLAGYAAGMVVAGLAFGIWQTWWMATLAFSVAAYRVVGTDYD